MSYLEEGFGCTGRELIATGNNIITDYKDNNTVKRVALDGK